MSPGPVPKPAALRQRKNKTSTRAALYTERRPRKRAPRLPKKREWDPLTRAWWREVWASPMASEYLEADIGGLFILARLVDEFWANPTDKTLAAEIRLQRQCFGLTPIDRRRLQWEVERGESAETRRQQRKVRGAQVGAVDPRDALRSVK